MSRSATMQVDTRFSVRSLFFLFFIFNVTDCHGGCADGDLLIPTGMQYSTDHIYENTPVWLHHNSRKRRFYFVCVLLLLFILSNFN